MTARDEEADRATLAYKWALTQIGIGVIQDQLGLWDGMNPAAMDTDAGYQSWLTSAQRLITLRGAWFQRLAITYYRLNRALRTGSTINVPGYPSKGVSVESLRVEFEGVLNEIQVHGGSTARPVGDLALADLPRPDLPPVSQEDKAAITLEDLPIDWDSLLAKMQADARDQAETALTAVGPDAFARKDAKRRRLDPNGDIPSTSQRRDADWSTAGSRVASQAERISMLYARGLTADLSKADEKVMGWVRYSQTGTPCAFCAMLISRGPIYKSYQSAGTTTEQQVVQEYHANCHCVAVPVFSDRQFNDSPLFALNRKYFQLWPEATKGYGGKDALSEWRKYLKDNGLTFEGETDRPYRNAA